MSEQVKYFLSRDVFSVVNRTRQYGSINDPVTVISRSGHVICIQRENGDRFYVLQEDLKESLTAASSSPLIAPVETHDIRKGRKSKKASKPGNTLF